MSRCASHASTDTYIHACRKEASSLDQNRVAKHTKIKPARCTSGARCETGRGRNDEPLRKRKERTQSRWRKEEGGKGRKEGGKEKKRDGVTVYTVAAIRCGTVRCAKQEASTRSEMGAACIRRISLRHRDRAMDGRVICIDRSRRAWTSTRADRCFLPPARPSGRLRPRRADKRMRHIARE